MIDMLLRINFQKISKYIYMSSENSPEDKIENELNRFFSFKLNYFVRNIQNNLPDEKIIKSFEKYLYSREIYYDLKKNSHLSDDIRKTTYDDYLAINIDRWKKEIIPEVRNYQYNHPHPLQSSSLSLQSSSLPQVSVGQPLSTPLSSVQTQDPRDVHSHEVEKVRKELFEEGKYTVDNFHLSLFVMCKKYGFVSDLTNFESWFHYCMRTYITARPIRPFHRKPNIYRNFEEIKAISNYTEPLELEPDWNIPLQRGTNINDAVREFDMVDDGEENINVLTAFTDIIENKYYIPMGSIINKSNFRILRDVTDDVPPNVDTDNFIFRWAFTLSPNQYRLGYFNFHRKALATPISMTNPNVKGKMHIYILENTYASLPSNLDKHFWQTARKSHMRIKGDRTTPLRVFKLIKVIPNNLTNPELNILTHIANYIIIVFDHFSAMTSIIKPKVQHRESIRLILTIDVFSNNSDPNNILRRFFTLSTNRPSLSHPSHIIPYITLNPEFIQIFNELISITGFEKHQAMEYLIYGLGDDVMQNIISLERQRAPPVDIFKNYMISVLLFHFYMGPLKSIDKKIQNKYLKYKKKYLELKKKLNL